MRIIYTHSLALWWKSYGDPFDFDDPRQFYWDNLWGVLFYNWDRMMVSRLPVLVRQSYTLFVSGHWTILLGSHSFLFACACLPSNRVY